MRFRFAFAPAFLALVLALAAGLALAGDSFPGFLPFSRGGGLSSGAADAAYLRLDATNDPVTGTADFSAGVRASNGSSASPSFSFTNDSNTGVFLNGADALGLTVGGGTKSAILTTTGLGVGVSPQYDFHAYSNSSFLTAFFHNASTGGTSRFLVAESGSTGYFGGLVWNGSTAGTLYYPGWSSATTGLYNTGAGGIMLDSTGTGPLRVRVNGAERMSLDSSALTATLPVRGPNGSASAPSFAASGDTNTGAYFPGADTYGIATAGTARVAWDPYSMISYVDIVPSSNEGADLGLNGYQWDQVRARQILSGNPGGTALSIGDSVEMREQTGTSAADYLKLPVHLNDDVTTKPTCSTSADAGKLVYFDDTGDAVVAGVCICGANAANSYGWRSISNFGVNCHL